MERQDSFSSVTNNTSTTASMNQRDGSMSPANASTKKFGFGMKIGSNVSNKNKLGTIFNSNDDDTNVADDGPKKKLSRLDDNSSTKETNGDSGTKEPSVDEKRKMIKNLIEKIPTVKEELFKYNLKWDIVDEVKNTIFVLDFFQIFFTWVS